MSTFAKLHKSKVVKEGIMQAQQHTLPVIKKELTKRKGSLNK